MATIANAGADSATLARWAISDGILRIGPEVDGEPIPRSSVVRLASFAENAGDSPDMGFLRPIFEDEDDHLLYWWAKRHEIVEVSFEGPVAPNGNLAYWFAGLDNLKSVSGLEMLRTQGVESAKGMFYACERLAAINMSCLRMQDMVDVSEMFAKCANLSEIAIEHFGGPRLEDASSMFAGCSGMERARLDGRGIRSLSRVDRMFSKCKKLRSVTLLGFQNSKISSAFRMFSGCSSLLSLRLAEVRFSEGSDLRRMFSGCRALMRVSMALPESGTDMEDMFAGCRKMASFDNLAEGVFNLEEIYDQDDDLKSESLSDAWGLFSEMRDMNEKFGDKLISAEQFLDWADTLSEEDIALLGQETWDLDLEQKVEVTLELSRFTTNYDAAVAIEEARLTEGPKPDVEHTRDEQDAQSESIPQKPIMQRALTDYNKRFKDEGTTLFRDEVIQQTLAVLIGKDKPNALLVGPAGTGKTKIVEDIAYRLANNDATIPAALRGFTIYELSLSGLVSSGKGLVGDVERAVEGAVNFAKDPARKAILFIDEIHMLCGASKEYEQIAQIIKPYLARGGIRVIGATTLQETRRLANDPAFNRRFSRITVDEPSREQTVEVLKQARPSILAHYGCGTITDSVLETVVATADMLSGAGSHRPDNALTLLDRAVGEAVVGRSWSSRRPDANDAADLVVDRAMVEATAFRIATGNSTRKRFDAEGLHATLRQVRGQEGALGEIEKLLRRANMGLFAMDRPLTMLLAGPSGTGKTQTAKILAREMTGRPPIVLNMTEFSVYTSITRIIGSPPSYLGSDSNSELPFDILASNPFQVILLDEFEKCHPSVQRLFMSAFDEGYFTTNRGQTADFSKAIVIATTNGGSDRRTGIGFVPGESESAAGLVEGLSGYFDIELLNRFQGIYEFRKIDRGTYRLILEDKYEEESMAVRAARPEYGLPRKMPEGELDKLVEETYNVKFGARPAQRAVRSWIEDWCDRKI